MEYQHWRGVPHLHGLISGLDNTQYAELARWYWRGYGFSRILEYDKNMGAGFYLCKYVTKELGQVDLSDSLVAFTHKH